MTEGGADPVPEPKPRTSGLAVVSLLLPVLSLPLAILIIWVWGKCSSTWPSLPPPDSVGVAWTALVVSLLSVILGIVALVRIRRHRERLAGTTRAIEAIVVSALAVLVWSMVLPIFARGQESGRMDQCMSQMHDLMLGVSMYLDDNSQSLPAASSWSDSIRPYVKYDGAFVCPDARRLKCGYAFNAALSEVKWGRLSAPGNTVVLFESDRG